MYSEVFTNLFDQYSKSPIPLFKVFMSQEAGKEALATLYSGMITQGPKVEMFEYELKKFLDVHYLLTVNSGTSALQLAATLAGVKEGDVVISTPMTCTATNTALKAVGAHIEWADINPVTGNIDPQSVAKLLHNGKQYAAIMAVDWGGYPCDWGALQFLARSYDIPLIEDAAHAFGAYFNEEMVGRIADFTCFSFQAIKHLTTVDGGALICKSEEHHKRGKLLRWFGIDRETSRKDFRCEEDVKEAGYKYHMNDVTASIGLGQLPHMQKVIGSHKQNGRYFDAVLSDINPHVRTIPRDQDRDSSYWVYTIHVEHRDQFMVHMRKHGVIVSQVHARNDTHTMFKDYAKILPGVDEFTRTQVNIPCGWWLTPLERDYIVECIRNFHPEIAQ